jgi:hypothetical protein
LIGVGLWHVHRDEARLSDLEPRFISSACGKRGADVFSWDKMPVDFNWNRKPISPDSLSE